MIPKERKRLAEADFPMAVVSRHAAREKFIMGSGDQMHLIETSRGSLNVDG